MSEPKSKSFDELQNQAEPNSKSSQQEFSNEFAAECLNLLDQSMIKILHCVSQLNDEQIWWRPGVTDSDSAMNSIGNLMLHLAGNLRQWAICGIGGEVDQRDRQAEFDQRNCVATDELARLLETTVAEARTVISNVPAANWTCRLEIQGFDVSTLQAISHTCSHFVGHTHQIVLLTRIQLGERYRFQWSPESDRNSVPI